MPNGQLESRALKQLEERSYLTLLFQFGTAQAILLLLLLLSLEAGLRRYLSNAI
jgi:hypothetical protein